MSGGGGGGGGLVVADFQASMAFSSCSWFMRATVCSCHLRFVIYAPGI